ncbi:UDP-4-amino-4,6-dideoxy-N-acetyl-beta-L-altrosamine N-acetyltransferase [Thermosynechococcus sp.]|uniref:UDP-4-amino-4, 6-dideoxy-N-acetyl-beta-L-altrosamine N-acetyltransferase n=1 Tax=Thermosynechococcus sp. TaxID=2814275 RepID=UPI003919247F
MKVLFLGGNELSQELAQWLDTVEDEVVFTREPIYLDFVQEIKPDFIVSYNYKHLVPEEVVEIYFPKIVNLHISLLPYNRGYHPNVWSFLDDTPKGVTIHLIDKGVDTGDILLQKEVFIDEEKETLKSSYLKLHQEIQLLFKENWELIKTGQITPVKQEGGGQSITTESVSSLNLSCESKDGIPLFEKLKKNIELGDVRLKNFIHLSLQEREMVRSWRNHPTVRQWMYSDHEISKLEHYQFIRKLVNSQKDFYYLLYTQEAPIGVLYLNRVDFRHQNAYFGIYANPEKRVHGAGILLEKAALRLAFDIAQLHTLKLEVIADNERALTFYRRMGFQEEGRLKEFVLKGGQRKDVIIMGMLSNDCS